MNVYQENLFNLDIIPSPSKIPSGFIKIDNILNGFNKSDLIIIAGRPNMGKTSFCLNIAHYISMNEKISVAYFSLDTTKEELDLRLLSLETGIPIKILNNFYITRKEQRGKNIDDRGKLFIDDRYEMDIIEIYSKAMWLKSQENIQLIVIEGLQLVKEFGKRVSRENKIYIITKFLKNLAIKLNVPVIISYHLYRNVEQRADKRPKLSDLRRLGSIEEIADVILFIYRDEVYNKYTSDKGIAEIIIAKHRDGPTGTLKLRFDSNTTKFYNLEP